MFKPRADQQEVLKYEGGWMGVSAVPGSGKTTTLSYLAARLIGSAAMGDDQEVLIVTLVNSAVDNFTNNVRRFVTEEFGLLPDMGYRVRTLHGLTADIVRERPDLAMLSDRFEIVDEKEAGDIIKTAALACLRSHPEFFEAYLSEDVDPQRQRDVATREIPKMMVSIANTFIRQVKDWQATPQQVNDALSRIQSPPLLLQMGAEIYSDYQRALQLRNAVDFDDLIRLALMVLRTDPDYLARLRYRWPYILEDEAQDSSRLQEEILRLLAGETGNWVRVGDPNQAIYETFTTASPRYLRNFMREPGVRAVNLPRSGRSTFSIIRLANQLIRWTNTAHPLGELRDSLTRPEIEPTQPGEMPPNPPDQPDSIFMMPTAYEPDKELDVITRSLKRWLPDHPDSTVAVLVPRNDRGSKLVEMLKEEGIEYHELLRSSQQTREKAQILSTILFHLALPSESFKLQKVYTTLRNEANVPAESLPTVQAARAVLKHVQRPEELLWPTPERDFLDGYAPGQLAPQVVDELLWFRQLICRWQEAALLPIDQLLLTIASDIFSSPADIALAHKIALVMERAAGGRAQPDLAEYALEIERIAANERKFLGLGGDDTGFNPEDYRGKVVVATMHKAKGLEWDRVYLLSANNYDFPSALQGDTFMSERWFIRNRLNLEEETRAQLNALMGGDPIGLYMEEGSATQQARLDYAAERLRLLFVGITRAKKELVITWNTGRNGDCTEAVAVRALREIWEGSKNA